MHLKILFCFQWSSLLKHEEGVKLPQGGSEMFKEDLSALHCTKSLSRWISSCRIYVRTFLPTHEAELPSIIKCPVLNAMKVGISWKVKIPRDYLYTALILFDLSILVVEEFSQVYHISNNWSQVDLMSSFWKNIGFGHLNSLLKTIHQDISYTMMKRENAKRDVQQYLNKERRGKNSESRQHVQTHIVSDPPLWLSTFLTSY